MAKSLSLSPSPWNIVGRRQGTNFHQAFSFLSSWCPASVARYCHILLSTRNKRDRTKDVLLSSSPKWISKFVFNISSLRFMSFCLWKFQSKNKEYFKVKVYRPTWRIGGTGEIVGTFHRIFYQIVSLDNVIIVMLLALRLYPFPSTIPWELVRAVQMSIGNTATAAIRG